MNKTRASARNIYLVGDEVVRLESNCLPTKRNVLSYYLYLHLKKKKLAKQSLNEAVSACEVVFKKIHQNVTQTINSKMKLARIVNVWCSLNKSKSRRTLCQVEKENKFMRSLEDIFNITADELNNNSKPTAHDNIETH